MVLDWEQDEAVWVLLQNGLGVILLLCNCHYGLFLWLVGEWDALDGNGDFIARDVLLVLGGEEDWLLEGGLHLE